MKLKAFSINDILLHTNFTVVSIQRGLTEALLCLSRPLPARECLHEQNVCRSLLEKDKLLFSFLLCTRIMAGKGEMDQVISLLSWKVEIILIRKMAALRWLVTERDASETLCAQTVSN